MPAEARGGLGNCFAAVTPETPPLRLNTPGWIDPGPLEVAELTSSDDMVALCRGRVRASTSPFAPPLRAFLDRYFDFVIAETAAPPDARPADIFAPADWVFSAWLPMAQAQIALPLGDDEGGPRFAEADVVFWLPGCLLCVILEGTSTRTKSQRQRLAFLESEHPQAQVVRFPMVRLDGEFPADLFPPAFMGFRDGLALPQGPFRSPALMRDFAEAADGAADDAN